MALRWKPYDKQVRVIYGDNPSVTDLVRSNRGKVFAVIGPFDNHADKPDLQAALETFLRGYNLEAAENDIR